MDYTAIVGIEALGKANADKQRAYKEADIRVVLCERGQESYKKVGERLKQLVEGPHLGTPCYEDTIIDRLALRDEKTLPPRLAVDATGVGRGVVDHLRSYGLDFKAVQLTGGLKEHRDGGYHNVPKKDLISLAVVGFQNGWIKIAEGLPHREQLEHELLNYRTKVNLRTGHESFEAWRERDHDDIVLALSLAIWCASKARTDWRRRVLVGTFDRFPGLA